jgi:hypothetical protein
MPAAERASAVRQTQLWASVMHIALSARESARRGGMIMLQKCRSCKEKWVAGVI